MINVIKWIVGLVIGSHVVFILLVPVCLLLGKGLDFEEILRLNYCVDCIALVGILFYFIINWIFD
jgi:hypothetical protein